MAFSAKDIAVTFTLGQGTFGDSGYDTVTVSGLRTRVQVQQAGGEAADTARIRISGLSLSMMNQLAAVAPLDAGVRRNLVAVTAIDQGQHTLVFKGQVASAEIDFKHAPATCLMLSAQSGLLEALKPADPISCPTQASAAEIMESLADRMGYRFENNGVAVILATPYFPGTLREQARRCAEAANIDWTITCDVLAIWPKSGVRQDQSVFLSPGTGLIGYPARSCSSTGLSVKCLFNPAVEIGRKVTLSGSVVSNANGVWRICGVTHLLDAEMPKGSWMTRFEAQPLA